MEKALIIALKAFFKLLYRLQYTVFLSGICSLPGTGGLCVHRKSYLFLTKKTLYLNKILEKVMNLNEMNFDDHHKSRK